MVLGDRRLLVGALLGFLAAIGGGYKATATLQFTSTDDGANGATAIGTTLEAPRPAPTPCSPSRSPRYARAARTASRYAAAKGRLPDKGTAATRPPPRSTSAKG